MINSSDKNVELTFEQLEQLDVFSKRLSALENNITITSKNLNVLMKEVIKATREKEYQEELLSTTTVAIERKKAELASLENSVRLKEEEIARFTSDEQARKQTLEQKETDIAERIIKLEETENQIREQQESVRAETEKQAIDRENLNKSMEAFSEAIKTVTWKSNKEQLKDQAMQ